MALPLPPRQGPRAQAAEAQLEAEFAKRDARVQEDISRDPSANQKVPTRSGFLPLLVCCLQPLMSFVCVNIVGFCTAYYTAGSVCRIARSQRGAV